MLIAATGNRCQRENKFISGSPTLHCGGQRRRRPDPLTPRRPCRDPCPRPQLEFLSVHVLQVGLALCLGLSFCRHGLAYPHWQGAAPGGVPAPRAPCLSSGKALSQNTGGLEAPSYTAGPQLGSQAGQRDLGPDSLTPNGSVGQACPVIVQSAQCAVRKEQAVLKLVRRRSGPARTHHERKPTGELGVGGEHTPGPHHLV